MVQRLYLMRHGQTLFNLKGRIQGSCDSPLTELGIEQATLARNYFKEQGIVFDALYASTQERACDTLEIVAESNLYKRLKGIKEWNFGLYEGESEWLNPPHQSGETSYGDFFTAYQGEGAGEVQERMNHTLSTVMAKGDASVLAVSHGGAMYMFIQKWVPFEIVKTIKFSNCCILVFDYAEGKFDFVEAVNPV